MRVTKQMLRSYLEQHKDEQHTRRDANLCPIAHCVMATNPRATGVEVNESYIHWHIGKGDQCHRVETPVWAKRFVSKVDIEDGIITGGEALAILEA